MINLNRLFHVLDGLWTKIGVSQRQNFSDEGVRCAGNANAARCGKAFQARSDIHAIAEQIASAYHHVTDMHPNPKPKTIVLWSALICLGNGILYGNGTLDRIHSARELGQDAVTGCIGNPPTMLGYEPVHDLEMGTQGTEGSDLVLLHEAGIASHVSGKDRRQPSLDLMLLGTHESLTLSE
jgi:hypothetical protein